MNFFSSNKKIGILGGGQLGKMLLASTRKWNITTHVLDPNNNAPANLCCNNFICGDYKDFDTVYKFGKNLDLITYEIEHVNLKALIKLKEEGVKIYPSPENLRVIQNKYLQKKFYIENDIPTAKYLFFKSKNDIIKAISSKKIKFPFVWKSTSMGYDGFGVKIVKNIQDFDRLNDLECICEDLVKLDKELAVIVCRNPNGEIVTYPTVEMEFNNESNQVEYVLCPARISNEISQKANQIALSVSKSFQHIGLLAVELFLTKNKKILVNEVAPRPHNSGHYSIEGAKTNQFDQHIRAILNLPLGDTSSISPTVMLNLVGDKNHNGIVQYKNINELFKFPGVNPHIYGKKQTRPFRKMGHITITNTSIVKAKDIAKKIKKIISIISK